jgi:hypothetical protein
MLPGTILPKQASGCDRTTVGMVSHRVMPLVTPPRSECGGDRRGGTAARAMAGCAGGPAAARRPRALALSAVVANCAHEPRATPGQPQQLHLRPGVQPTGLALHPPHRRPAHRLRHHADRLGGPVLRHRPRLQAARSCTATASPTASPSSAWTSWTTSTPTPVPTPPQLICAPVSSWTPPQRFDLITCIHGLHYVGDKLATLTRAAIWLTDDGLLVADLTSPVSVFPTADPPEVLSAAPCAGPASPTTHDGAASRALADGTCRCPMPTSAPTTEPSRSGGGARDQRAVGPAWPACWRRPRWSPIPDASQPEMIRDSAAVDLTLVLEKVAVLDAAARLTRRRRRTDGGAAVGELDLAGPVVAEGAGGQVDPFVVLVALPRHHEVVGPDDGGSVAAVDEVFLRAA